MKETTRIVTLTIEVTKKGVDETDFLSKEIAATFIKEMLEARQPGSHVHITRIQDFVRDEDENEH